MCGERSAAMMQKEGSQAQSLRHILRDLRETSASSALEMLDFVPKQCLRVQQLNKYPLPEDPKRVIDYWRSTGSGIGAAERNMKYTAPIRHSPAHRKSSLSGCFMYNTAKGTNTVSVMASCRILSWPSESTV